MKAPLILLILSCSLVHSAEGSMGLDVLFEESCCDNLTSVMIPLKRVRQVKETPENCRIQALIVTTVCEKRVCVDPRTSWAKRLKKTWKPSKTECPNLSVPKSPKGGSDLKTRS